MKLFTVGKVGCFCEAAGLSTETRKGETVKIAVLTLRVDPFDAKLASAMGAPGVRSTLFKLNHPEPNPVLGPHIDLAVGCPRQVLKVFSTPDTAAGMAFDQVRVYGVAAHQQKDAAGFALRFKVSFGPLSRTELEFINEWRLSQRYVTFDEAEPNLFDEEPEEPADDPAPAPRGLLEGDAPEPARQPAPRHADAKSRAKAKQQHAADVDRRRPQRGPKRSR